MIGCKLNWCRKIIVVVVVVVIDCCESVCYKIRQVAKESAQFPCTLGTNRNLTSLSTFPRLHHRSNRWFSAGSVLVSGLLSHKNQPLFYGKNGNQTEFGKPVPSAAADYITRGARGAPVLRPQGVSPRFQLKKSEPNVRRVCDWSLRYVAYYCENYLNPEKKQNLVFIAKILRRERII